jgi:serine/threonine protein kinase
MAVACPYCAHAIEPKGVKPGRYATRCPKCGKKFALTVPVDRLQGLVATVLAPEGERPAPGQPSGVRRSTAATEAAAAQPGPGPAPRRDARATGSSLPATEALPRSSAGAATTFPLPTEGDYQLAPGVTGQIPATLAGYQIIKPLGHGGMGAVYLARQRSLDRNVALKVMKPQWAGNATFVARFTREAYAAAQLNHHNVVQIYDFGDDRGTTYFSMEFVDGQSLAGLVRQKKRLEAGEAVGYVLQAARGLKYAHDQSMVHRDVKPDNLLLNTHGIVKVADLGLVKTPEVAEADDKLADVRPPSPASAGEWASAAGGSEITRLNVAMGTPAFMAPEQARDAARADARADIYSLGCTLYVLVTGRPPFEGGTALEVISKHQSEPVTPPELVDERVPPALSAIIMRMVAKKPEDRYFNLGEVIAALEQFQGVPTAGSFSPREEHARVLEECAAAFHASPSARLRAKVVPGLLAAWVAIVALFALSGRPVMVGGFLGLGLLTLLAYFLVDGVTRRSYLFGKARELTFASPIGDWLMAGTGLAVLVVTLFVLKLFWAWALFGVVAVLIALGIHVYLDRRADLERSGPLEQADGLIRSLRAGGLEEDAIQQFVCTSGGDRWEEFFEALFGFESKLEARRRWVVGDLSRARPKFAAWREPIVAWIDVKINRRRQVREKKLLQQIEEKGLQAQGINLLTARRKAQRAAEAMVTLAAEIKQSQAATRTAATIPVNYSIARAMREAAANPEQVLVGREHGLLDEESESVARRVLSTTLDLALGPRTRFLAGAAMLAGCLIWMHQNGMISAEQVKSIAESAQSVDMETIKKAADLDKIQAAAKKIDIASINAKAKELKALERDRKVLEIPLLPSALAKWLSSFGAGVAGLILVFSSFFGGNRIAVFAVPAAAVTIIGPRLPTSAGLEPSLIPIIVGLGLLIAGILFGRTRP